MTPRQPYQVEVAPAAQRQFQHLSPADGARLRGPLLALALDPRPPGSAKLEGTGFWRVRVGDLRLVYLVDDRRRRVVVLRVAKRAERTYRGLGS